MHYSYQFTPLCNISTADLKGASSIPATTVASQCKGYFSGMCTWLRLGLVSGSCNLIGRQIQNVALAFVPLFLCVRGFFSADKFKVLLLRTLVPFHSPRTIQH